MGGKVNSELLMPEIRFAASRSGGPGGQLVNKVSSRVTLRFDIVASLMLSEEEKATLLRKLQSRTTKDGVLVISSQESRSQHQNKAAVIQKFDELLTRAFAIKKKRVPTRISKGAHQKRLDAKKRRGAMKKWRRGGE